MKLAIAIIASLLLAGCFCTYKGKPVSKAEAARMQDLGMDVVCP